MSGKTKTKTKSKPYDPAAIKRGTGALDTGYGQAQGTIAQWSPTLNTAIQHISDNIKTPPAYLTDARSELDRTIRGDYLDPSTNPFSAGMAKLIGDRTQGNYNATFGASGRAHGGLAALLSSQGVGDAVGGFYNNIYNQERGRQMSATMGAPSFHQDEYTDINELFPAVQQTAGLPLNAAATYAGGLGSLLSPYGTQTTTQQKKMGLADYIGLAAQVAGAAFGVPPIGLMGGGGGLGGVLGGGSAGAAGKAFLG